MGRIIHILQKRRQRFREVPNAASPMGAGIGASLCHYSHVTTWLYPSHLLILFHEVAVTPLSCLGGKDAKFLSRQCPSCPIPASIQAAFKEYWAPVLCTPHSDLSVPKPKAWPAVRGCYGSSTHTRFIHSFLEKTFVNSCVCQALLSKEI